MKNQKFDTFLLENYENIGCKACAKILNISEGAIDYAAKRLKLKISKKAISEIRKNVANERYKDNWLDIISSFENVSTPEAAYLLGYFWADGYVGPNTVSMTISKEDMDEISNIFKSTGNWTIKSAHKGSLSKKDMSIIYCCSKKLVNIFKLMNYHNKSGGSPLKALKKIPENLHNYWFRGYFDGDGCIYFNKKSYRSTITIASVADQNWDFIKLLAKNLDINFNLYIKDAKYKYKNKTLIGKCSMIMICGAKNIQKFFDYIYSDNLSKFGLKRKYNIFINLFHRPHEKFKKKKAFIENPEKYKLWT